MDFVASNAPDSLTHILISAAIFVVVAIALVAVSKRAYSANRELSAWVFVGASLLCMALPTVSIVQTISAYCEHEAAVGAEIKDSYGLELTKYEVRALNHPNEQPEEDFRVYGSFERNEPTPEGFKSIMTHLIWKDGKLMLAESSNGETYREIVKK